MRKPKTAEILEGVLQELAQLYPGLLFSAYIALGIKIFAFYFSVTDLLASLSITLPHSLINENITIFFNSRLIFNYISEVLL